MDFAIFLMLTAIALLLLGTSINIGTTVDKILEEIRKRKVG